MNFIYEHFNSSKELLSVLALRKNNAVMLDKDSSDKRDTSFTKTKSYKEATDLLTYGYTDVLNDIKLGIRANEKKLSYYQENRIKPKNNVVGYIPNVPNAIRNIPQSMITVEKTSNKKKAISIIYTMGGACYESADNFVKAGVALLTAIKIIELNGISCKLSVGFMPSQGDKQIAYPTLLVKNYGQKLDLQRVCFPLVHPSMFRRIGFKWLETSPQVSDYSFSNGYGAPISGDIVKTLTSNYMTEENNYFISYLDIKQNDYSTESILKSFNIIK